MCLHLGCCTCSLLMLLWRFFVDGDGLPGGGVISALGFSMLIHVA
jgi:hypothetical protein